jgi:hypothetical protein
MKSPSSGFWLGMWGDDNDKKLVKTISNFSYTYVDATRKDYISWLYVSILEKLARVGWKFKKTSILLSYGCTYQKINFSTKCDQKIEQ